MQPDYPEIILASASAARAAILGSAGVRFHQRPSSLNEDAEHKRAEAQLSPSELALYLAKGKAQLVAAEDSGSIVIGADQVLAVGGEILRKPRTEEDARTQLRKLRGRSHQLYSAAVVMHRGEVSSYLDVATLSMRDFSDEFLDWYLETASESVLNAVGAYHFEGLGIHLFSKVEGDYYTILGLPVLPILDELRRLKILMA